MSDFNPEKGICGKYYYSNLILRKRQQKVAECLWKLMDTMLYPKALADSGLEDLRTKILTWKRQGALKRFEDEDFGASLDEDS